MKGIPPMVSRQGSRDSSRVSPGSTMGVCVGQHMASGLVLWSFVGSGDHRTASLETVIVRWEGGWEGGVGTREYQLAVTK